MNHCEVCGVHLDYDFAASARITFWTNVKRICCSDCHNEIVGKIDTLPSFRRWQEIQEIDLQLCIGTIDGQGFAGVRNGKEDDYARLQKEAIEIVKSARQTILGFVTSRITEEQRKQLSRY